MSAVRSRLASPSAALGLWAPPAAMGLWTQSEMDRVSAGCDDELRNESKQLRWSHLNWQNWVGSSMAELYRPVPSQATDARWIGRFVQEVRYAAADRIARDRGYTHEPGPAEVVSASEHLDAGELVRWAVCALAVHAEYRRDRDERVLSALATRAVVRSQFVCAGCSSLGAMDEPYCTKEQFCFSHFGCSWHNRSGELLMLLSHACPATAVDLHVQYTLHAATASIWRHGRGVFRPGSIGCMKRAQSWSSEREQRCLEATRLCGTASCPAALVLTDPDVLSCKRTDEMMRYYYRHGSMFRWPYAHKYTIISPIDEQQDTTWKWQRVATIRRMLQLLPPVWCAAIEANTTEPRLLSDISEATELERLHASGAQALLLRAGIDADCFSVIAEYVAFGAEHPFKTASRARAEQLAHATGSGTKRSSTLDARETGNGEAKRQHAE